MCVLKFYGFMLFFYSWDFTMVYNFIRKTSSLHGLDTVKQGLCFRVQGLAVRADVIIFRVKREK